MLTQFFFLYKRLVMSNLKMPIFLFFALAQPVMWLVLFGQLFSNVPGVKEFSNESYIAFLTPGMAILAAMFGSAYSGLGTLADMERGMFDRILIATQSRALIPISYVFSTMTTVILQALILLLAGLLLGAFPKSGISGFFVVLMTAALVGITFGGFSNVLVFMFKRQEPVMTLASLITMPLTFLSSMMIAAKFMPDWISSFVVVNPVDWAVIVARAGYNGVWATAATELICLTLLAGFSTCLMIFSFKKFLKSL